MELNLKALSKDELIEKYFDQERIIKDQNKRIEDLKKENSIFKELFDSSPTPMWEEDITELVDHLDLVRDSGVINFNEYFNSNPEKLTECIDKIKLINVNKATVNLHRANSKEHLIANLKKLFTNKSFESFRREIIAIADGVKSFECETDATTFNKDIIDLKLYLEIIERKENGKAKYFALVSTVDITLQRAAEIKLRANENKLRVILDASDDAAMLIDQKGFIVETNKASEALYGVRRSDIVGRTLKHFTNKELIKQRSTAFKKAIETKQIITIEDDAYGRRWISRISPILNYDDNVEGVVVFHRDVTSIFAANKRKEDSVLKYRTIFNNIQSSITHIDNNGFITDINKYHLHNISKKKRLISDFIGTNILERRSIIKAGIIKYYEELLNGKSFELSNIHFPETTGGTNAYFNIKGIPLFVNTKVTGAIITTEDVTEEVLSKSRLAETEKVVKENSEYIQSIFSSAPIGIGVVVNRYIKNVNEKLCKMVGYDENELIGKNARFLYPDDDEFEKVGRVKYSQIEKYGTGSIETKWKCEDGKIIDLILSSTPIDSGDLLKGVTFTALDITARKKAEKILQKTKEQLQFAIEGSGAGMWDWHIKTGECEFNERWANIIGYSLEDLIPTNFETWTQFVHKDDLIKSNDLLQMHFKGISKTYVCEVRMKHRAGEWIWVLDRGQVVERNIKGEPVRMVGTHIDITELKAAEEALRLSEVRYQTLFNYSPVPLWVEDFNELTNHLYSLKARGIEDFRGYFIANPEELTLCSKKIKIIDVNEATLKLHKADNKKELIANLDKIFTQNFITVFREEVIMLAEGGQEFETECEVKTLDGESKHVYFKLIINKDKSLVKRGLLATLDITQRKNAEDELQKSKALYKTVSQLTSDFAYAFKVEKDGTLVSEWVTGALTSITGYSKDELQDIGGWETMIYEADKSIPNDQFKSLLAGKASDVEYRIVSKDGNIRWTQDYAQPVWDIEGNRTTYIYGAIKDVTERKQAEEKYSTLVEQANEGIVIIQDMLIKYGNKYLFDLIGYKEGEVTDSSVEKFIPEDALQIVKENFERRINGEDVQNIYESKIKRKDGRIIPIEINTILIKYENKPAVQSIIRDITDRKRADEILKETNEKLRNLYRYMNNIREEERKNIAREVHDDLGQKLTALNLDISWIKQNIPSDQEKLKEQFTPVLDLLNQSIITVQKISTELRPGILDDLGLVNAIQWQSNEISRRSELNFFLNLAKDEIELDDNIKTQLFRVYQEILTNIVRHSRAKNVNVNLLFKRRNLIFEVADDGVGIPQLKLKDNHSYGIIGMKERISAINGIITISKKNKKGTLIKINVPI